MHCIYYLLRLVTDVIWHCMFAFTSLHCILVRFSILIISFFFYPSCLPQSRGGEVTEIGKCWCAASDIVSDHKDNSAKNRKFCMKFVHFIFRKIIQFVDTRCQILMQKRTKIDFCWGSASDPIGGAYSALQTPSWILGALLLREGRANREKENGKGREKRGKGEGKR